MVLDYHRSLIQIALSPILLAVWFMGYVTKFAKKVIPKSLQYFMSPLVIMLITLPATLLVFGPLGFLYWGRHHWLLQSIDGHDR